MQLLSLTPSDVDCFVSGYCLTQAALFAGPSVIPRDCRGAADSMNFLGT